MSQPPRVERRPSFLITIDTEGDNLWSKPRDVTTRNSLSLPRFQALCEEYGLKPTYLTNWEMARCPDFREFGRDLVARGVGEIGMHLHAWNSPPLVPLTDDDDAHQPYLIEYPEDQIRAKVKAMTDVLEETFEVDVVSHRAGRWSFDKTYARILIEHGYRVDCSVTPHVSWSSYAGDPRKAGGTDFRQFPESAYFIDPDDIGCPGDSPLLEVPMTIVAFHYAVPLKVGRELLMRNRYGAALARRLLPELAWLRPKGGSSSQLQSVLAATLREGRDYAEFMLHSSEFMPGGSPTFPDERSIEALYESLEALFEAVRASFDGRTLREYHDRYVGSRAVRE
jgi:hypothetical protein